MITVLRIIVFLYIGLTFIFAGLNYGAAPNASPETRELLHNVWQAFENPYKTLILAAAVFISILLYRRKKSGILKNRLPLLLGFIGSALVIHLLLPLIFSNWEIYFAAMPLPWTTIGMQIQVTGKGYGMAFAEMYGSRGADVMIWIFWLCNIVVLGTAVFGGRRVWCSQLCLFNGFMAETFAPGLTRCTSCGACNRNCPAGLDVMGRAEEEQPIRSYTCFGCGRCVESCPTGNLRYSTAFTRFLLSRQA